MSVNALSERPGGVIGKSPTAGSGIWTLDSLREYTPLTIPGLSLWLHAADAVLSGSNVSSWPDRSGRGFTADVFSGTPTYGATDMNGRPAVKFDGSSAMRIDASVYSFGITDPITIVAAIKAPAPGTAVAARRPLMCGGTANGTVGIGLALRLFSGAQDYGGLVDRVGTASVNISSSTAVSNVRKIMAVNYDGTDGQFFLNGTQAAAATNISTTLSAATANTGRVTIGSQIIGSTVTFPTVVDFAEIIVYSRSLSASERQRITQYLAAQYSPE